jgi:hypothetical protein
MKRMAVCLFLVALLLTTGAGLLTADKPFEHPCARGYANMIYDWESGEAYLLGGVEETGWYYLLNDIWSFNTFTKRWKKIFEDTDGSSFNAFQAETMTIDPRSKKILVYANLWWNYTAETWIFDIRDGTFKNITSGTEPTSRWGSRMVYDTESKRAILFGGSDNNDYHTYNETWAYDFKTNTWTNMNPTVSPPPHHYGAMVYLPFEDKVVLFGGYDIYADAVRGETWVYDFHSNTWTNMQPAVSPAPRIYHTLEWDVASNQAILFGGVAYLYEPVLNDTWAYDFKHNEWRELAPRTSPSARAWHVMTGTWRGILMFGGAAEHSVFTNDDTWLYKSHINTWKKINYK